MSPTATIAAVVVALLFFAWLFQTDLRDPAYEDALKRQSTEKQEPQPIRNSLGVAITDPGVTKSGPADTKAVARIVTGTFDPQVLPTTYDAPLPNADRQQNPDSGGFGTNARLQGTFVGIAHVADATPDAASNADDPAVTFNRDGTFVTQNMAAAEVDMEAASAAGVTATTDRGAGRYRLSANTLDLTYTDGLTRKKGNHRTYTVVPVAGPDHAPTMITLQGKVFKLDPNR